MVVQQLIKGLPEYGCHEKCNGWDRVLYRRCKGWGCVIQTKQVETLVGSNPV